VCFQICYRQRAAQSDFADESLRAELGGSAAGTNLTNSEIDRLLHYLPRRIWQTKSLLEEEQWKAEASGKDGHPEILREIIGRIRSTVSETRTPLFSAYLEEGGDDHRGEDPRRAILDDVLKPHNVLLSDMLSLLCIFKK